MPLTKNLITYNILDIIKHSVIESNKETVNTGTQVPFILTQDSLHRPKPDSLPNQKRLCPQYLIEWTLLFLLNLYEHLSLTD